MAIPEKVKKAADRVRAAIYGGEVQESIAKGLEDAGEVADESNGRSKSTENRQTKVETDFKTLQREYTENGNGAQTSAEITVARDGELVLDDRLKRDFGNINAQLEQKELKSTKNIKETDAVFNDNSFDNAQILKDFFEKNDSVRLEGTLYSSEITIDRTGKPPLYIEGDFELVGIGYDMPHVLRIDNGRVFHKGTLKINGSKRALDGLYLGLGTSHSVMDSVFVYSVKRNGVYNEYVTMTTFNILFCESCGDRKTTTYKKNSDSTATGKNGFSTIQMDAIGDEVFNIDSVHFVIINNVLYKVLKLYRGSLGEKLLDIYPKNLNLSASLSECKVLIGTGLYNKGTASNFRNLDLRACGLGIYSDAQYGTTYENAVFQGTPVGITYGKDGIGTQLSQSNVVLSPYFENNIPFPIVTSLSSQSGVAVIEPLTTTGELDFVTKFGDYSPVSVTKNGKIYQNNRITKTTNDSNSKNLTIGDDLFIKNNTPYDTSIDVVVSEGVQRFVTNSQESKIFVHNTTPRPINVVARTGYTVEGSGHKSVLALKGIIHVILDSTEKDYSVFYQELT